MWRMGLYVQSAVSVSVEHCLAGRKAKSKYIEKPLLLKTEPHKDQSNKVLLTEEEKKKQTERLFAQLKIMGANFKLNNKN